MPLKESKLKMSVRELLEEQFNGLPVWIRSPKLGTEHYTGLSRAKMYELAGAGRIRSVSLREPGQVKGTRLFLLSSILEYLEKCEREWMDQRCVIKRSPDSQKHS